MERNNGARRRSALAAAFTLGILGLACAGPANAANVLVDFGIGTNQTTLDAVNRTWNNVTDSNDTGGSPFTLLSTAGADSGYRLSVSNPPAGVTNRVGFNGANTNGTTAPTGTAAARNYPASATGDSLFGNTGSFNNLVVEATRIVLSNLNPTETYSLDFFASRTGVSDNREVEYHVVGGNSNQSVFLNPSNNTGNLVGVTGVTPDANNQITIDIDPGPNNNNSTGFFYLGVLDLSSTPAPEPSTLALTTLATLPLLRRHNRKRTH